MKRGILMLAAAFALTACGGPGASKSAATADTPDMHTAENALDYTGVYKGTTPAADCPGIEVTLTLQPDGTYSEHNKYLERDSEFTQTGGYAVSGNLLTLTPIDGDDVTCYKVEENRLRRLDADKKPIEGDLADKYILTKIH